MLAGAGLLLLLRWPIGTGRSKAEIQVDKKDGLGRARENGASQIGSLSQCGMLECRAWPARKGTAGRSPRFQEVSGCLGVLVEWKGSRVVGWKGWRGRRATGRGKSIKTPVVSGPTSCRHYSRLRWAAAWACLGQSPQSTRQRSIRIRCTQMCCHPIQCQSQSLSLSLSQSQSPPPRSAGGVVCPYHLLSVLYCFPYGPFRQVMHDHP